MKTIGIGLLGLGTVGSGVVKALNTNGTSITGKLNAPLEIRKILVRDLAKKRAVQVDKKLITNQFAQILEDPAINLVVDAMGGIEPAKDYILQALKQGKHVVTANKEVIAKHGREILQAAEDAGVTVSFEASVGGGIPIIRPLKQCLAGNEISEVMGIINGTTNYILTKMATEGKDFASILKEAQEMGYAEPDPTNDVEGYDAGYKLVILTALAFGGPIDFEDIRFEGISRVTREDMVLARKLGYTVKLLAVAKDHGPGLEVRVTPCLLPLNHPLAGVNDVFNGIFIKGNLVGELLFTGRGAGDLPTASAIVADLIDVAKDILAERPVRPVCTCYRSKPVLPSVNSSYYLRVKVSKSDAVLPVNNLLIQEQVSYSPALKQQGRGGNIVYFTNPLSEEEIAQVAAKISAISGVREVSLFRLEGQQAETQAASNPGIV